MLPLCYPSCGEELQTIPSTYWEIEDSKDKVNNLKRGLHRASAQYLSTQSGIPSGPGEYTGLTR